MHSDVQARKSELVVNTLLMQSEKAGVIFLSKEEPLTMREILTGHVHTRKRGKDLTTIPDYPSLKFSSIEHYNETLSLAEKLGGEALKSFKNGFATLERICKNDNGVAEVHPDSAKNSFYFRIYQKDGSLDLDGGIILHGMNYPYSVELCPKSGIYWSMHT